MIFYTIKFNEHSNKDLSSVCWAKFSQVMTNADPNDFLGVDYYLSSLTTYGDKTNREQKDTHDEIFHALFDKWMKPSWYSLAYDTNGNINKICYTNQCPYYMLLASSCVHRLPDNNDVFIKYWEEMEHLNLHPWVRYLACININQFSSGSDTTMYRLSGSDMHMPMSYHAFENGGLYNIIKRKGCRRLSMKKELERTGKLTFDGRDAFFRGTKETTSHYVTETLSEYVSGISKPNMYTSPSIKKRELFSQLVKLNEEVKSC